MLAAPPTREVSRTLLVSSLDPDREERLGAAFRSLEEQAVEEMVAEGNERESLTIRHWVDARYGGQSFELRVARQGWIESFHKAHQDRYGYSRRDSAVEAVTLRAVAEAPPLSLTPTELPEAEGNPPFESDTAYLEGNEIQLRRVWRKDLLRGHTLVGPAIVLEYSSTTWLPPGWRLEVDIWGSLLLSRE
jgi:N-methylhydantoinase A